MMKPRIIVLGSSNTDLIVRVPCLPRPGETVLGGEFVTAAGGKGANQAVAAARAGGDVTFIARVGRDSFGQRALAGLARDQVRLRFVHRDAGAPSGVALIFVALDGQNSIAVAPGANARLSQADVKRAQSAFAGADVLLAQLETPLLAIQAAFALATQHKMLTILNPAPARPLPNSLLRRVSILTPNEIETQTLTGIKVQNLSTCIPAAAKLRARGAATVIITLGARGAFVADADTQQIVPGFKVTAVDTTAAGDVFNGALAVALAEGRPMIEAVRFANAAAAISVTRIGAQRSTPERREIEILVTQASPGQQHTAKCR